MDVDAAVEDRKHLVLVVNVCLVNTDCQHNVARAGTDMQDCLVQGGCRSGASVLYVDHWNPFKSYAAQRHLSGHHHLPFEDGLHRVAEVGGVDIGELCAGILQGPRYCLPGEIFDGYFAAHAERSHADTHDPHGFGGPRTRRAGVRHHFDNRAKPARSQVAAAIVGAPPGALRISLISCRSQRSLAGDRVDNRVISLLARRLKCLSANATVLACFGNRFAHLRIGHSVAVECRA